MNTTNLAHPPLKSIPQYFSVYLDFLRFGAAVFVLLFHLSLHQMGPENLLAFIPQRGHDFVIMFFVLSGYVIAATVDRKRNQGLRAYVIDRMARVYSVAIPALLLSIAMTFFFGDMASAVFSTVVNFFFLGQFWFNELHPFWNQPYWSLCYEVMYYIGFGCFIFLRGVRRWVGLLLFLLLAGPKVLILMPCWLFGVAIYYWRDKVKLSWWTALLIAFLFPAAVAILLNKLHFGAMVREWIPALLGGYFDAFAFSDYFIADYVTALIVAVHMYAMRFVVIRWPDWLASFVTQGAAISFTLYLMHLPLIFLIKNTIASASNKLLLFVLTGIGIPLFCYAISRFTEARRGALRQWLDTHLPFKKIE